MLTALTTWLSCHGVCWGTDLLNLFSMSSLLCFMLSIRWRCSFVVIFSNRLRGGAPAEVGGAVSGVLHRSLGLRVSLIFPSRKVHFRSSGKVGRAMLIKSF